MPVCDCWQMGPTWTFSAPLVLLERWKTKKLGQLAWPNLPLAPHPVPLPWWIWDLGHNLSFPQAPLWPSTTTFLSELLFDAWSSFKKKKKKLLASSLLPSLVNSTALWPHSELLLAMLTFASAEGGSACRQCPAPSLLFFISFWFFGLSFFFRFPPTLISEFARGILLRGVSSSVLAHARFPWRRTRTHQLARAPEANALIYFFLGFLWGLVGWFSIITIITPFLVRLFWTKKMYFCHFFYLF